ncbi:MAG: bifunctional [glutamate--ammonia ligase]-adenylyl-L-tyrosine phosphorylase/[glutamate--ammonia-ligase] adenylyltransferase [Pseudomonadota bacterium]
MPPGACDDIVAAAGQRVAAAAPALAAYLAEHHADAFARAAVGSDFVVRTLCRHGDAMLELIRDGGLAAAVRPGDFRRRLRAAAAAAASLPAVLRRQRDLEQARILWRDISGVASLDETMASLSAAADASIELALTAAGEALAERHGRVRDTDGDAVALTALAMGKLGGRELNVSSDVDLIFVYRGGRDSDGARPLSPEEYFTRQARRAIALLDEVTADGFVYRVDVRLRPFGDSGALVSSHDALESYLTQHGRDWERYAYVKARLLGSDDPRDTESLAAILRPFVYRRYLDYGVFESLRSMKQLIEDEVTRRELSDNVKLGPGGIREVEFVVQSLQLVRGGSEPALQRRSLLRALAALTAAGHVGPRDGDELERAYRFLRHVENRIQALHDRQQHALPDDPVSRERIAAALGFADTAALQEGLAAARRAVRRQFERTVFRTANADAHAAAGFSGSTDMAEYLAANHDGAGEAFAQDACDYMERLNRRPLDDESRRRVQSLLPHIVDSAARHTDPRACFARLTRVLDAIVRRSAYVSLLIENPDARRRFSSLAGASEFLADELGEMPMLFDELLDHRLYAQSLNEASLRADLAARLRRHPADDVEARLEAVARFKRAAQFRVAVADYTGTLTLMRIADLLTVTAELVVDAALALARTETAARYGEPLCYEGGRPRRAGIAVVAYGKLGGLELGYGSDLDIVFLHDSAGDPAETSGPKVLANDVYFQRLVRRVTHFLTVTTSSGRLYEVDLRLRPSGRAGLLVSSLSAFERYQQHDAWTWEHQALLRSRSIAGDAAIRDAFESIRVETLRHHVRRESLAADVAAMRQRMRGELSRSGSGEFDIKQDAGGLADIEFLVQYLVLNNAGEHPELLHYSDNIRQLDALGRLGIIAAETAAGLGAIYLDYRATLNRCALDRRPAVVDAAGFDRARAAVTAAYRPLLGD